jgi:nucleotidyltransferase/DNA polymerase involved in DNA repair
MSSVQRVILVIDYDYFYAQTEELLDPDLSSSVPVCVQQKHIVVTCK